MVKLQDSKQLYFIAIIPPLTIQDEVIALKNEMSQKYNSRHALKSPPHITLLMPFKWKEEKESIIEDFLKTFALLRSPFNIRLNGFGAFPKRVIFIDVVKNELLYTLANDLLSAVRKELKILVETYKNKGFTAHMTVAHRDLKPMAFEEAWKEFRDKPFDREFLVNHISLLKHDGHQWRVYKDFKFENPNG